MKKYKLFLKLAVIAITSGPSGIQGANLLSQTSTTIKSLIKKGAQATQALAKKALKSISALSNASKNKKEAQRYKNLILQFDNNSKKTDIFTILSEYLKFNNFKTIGDIKDKTVKKWLQDKFLLYFTKHVKAHFAINNNLEKITTMEKLIEENRFYAYSLMPDVVKLYDIVNNARLNYSLISDFDDITAPELQKLKDGLHNLFAFAEQRGLLFRALTTEDRNINTLYHLNKYFQFLRPEYRILWKIKGDDRIYEALQTYIQKLKKNSLSGEDLFSLQKPSIQELVENNGEVIKRYKKILSLDQTTYKEMIDLIEKQHTKR